MDSCLTIVAQEYSLQQQQINGSTINSSGNVASSITVGSSSKITIDPSNERILIED